MLAPEREAAPAAVVSAAPGRRRHRVPGLDFLFTAVFALFGFGVGIERLSDNSFFIHLRTGRLILDHGIPRQDVYSYTAAGTRWVAQSWLAETAYAAIDRAVGPFGIRLLGGITGMAIAVLAFRLALRLSHDRVRAALLTVTALAGLYTLWSERPLLLGVLFLVVLAWIVEVPDSGVGRYPVLSLPAVFWLWANVHGSFALGAAYLGLHLLGRWLDGAPPWAGREKGLLAGAAIAALAAFANPYGAALVVFPVHLLSRGDVLRHVIEWASPDFHRVSGQALLLWLAVFVVVVARSPRRVTRRDLVVAVPFLALALWALRNVAIAPLVGLPIAARAVAVEPKSSRRHRLDERRSPIGWALVGVLVVTAGALVVRAASQPDFVTRPYPVQAMNALEDAGLIGRRLLTDDADAAYVVLGYFPEQKVFIDDRYDMYPRSVIADYFALSNGSPGWRRVLDRRDVEVVVWDRDHPLAEYLRRSGEWTLIHRDASWVAFVRDDVMP